jgi:hypothetical protein
MTTNRTMELMAGTFYPRSMKHLQQLIMDADACSKCVGKKTLFGKDKFAPKLFAFERTLITCAIALEEDGQLGNSRDSKQSLEAIDKAMGMLAAAYSSWPAAFEFWEAYCSEALDREA